MKAIKNKRAIIVGIFIFIGLVILIVTVFTLGGQKKTFVKAVPVKAVFDDVGGLQPGNNVWLSGVKIGTIKRLIFTRNTAVEVTMNIDDRVVPLIRKDSKAKISSNGLMGNKIVVIYGGTKASPPVGKNDYLMSEKPINTEDMLAILQANNKNLLEITTHFKDITKKISDGEGTIGALLNDASIANNLRSAILTLQSAVSNFKTTAVQSQKVIDNLRDFTAQLNKKGTLMNDFVTDTVIFNNLRGTVDRLREVASTAAQITGDIKNATSQLNKKNNAAGALLSDDELAASLKNTVTNLEAGSKNLNEDLIALQHNFLLRGYFKKKKKE
jgi:phospholipid/cholesterol/gamma-HCH transport system substrate-binding protein